MSGPVSVLESLSSSEFLETLRGRLARYGPDADDAGGTTLLRAWQLERAARSGPERGTALRWSRVTARGVANEIRANRPKSSGGPPADELPTRDGEPLALPE